MKKKYFIRGFGVGVLVASILFACISLAASGISQQESDLLSSANEATEGTVTKESEDTVQGTETASETPEIETEDPNGTETLNSETPTEVPTEAATETVGSSQAASTAAADAESSSTDADASDSSISSGSSTGTTTSQSTTSGSSSSDDTLTVTVEIQSGQTSVDVAETVEAAGLITDADEFNTYLIEHEYATRLQVGTFELTVGSTYEQIAQKITSRTK